MTYISRAITSAIQEAYSSYSVIVVTGPRQSGKTTLIKNMFTDLAYYSMEDIDVRLLAQSDARAFLSVQGKGMIIDEVQQTPELLSYIQGIVDNNPDVRFVLSGSSQFALLKSITQSLAGRAAVFELLPMSYEELPRKDQTLDELLFSGMYPAVAVGRKNAYTLYKNYTQTYLERDVRDLLAVRDIDKFQKFLRLCAARIGSIFNASELSNELGVSTNTVNSWVSILKASYVVFMLQPFYENTRKRLIKSPKIYFTDTGLACYLLEIETASQLRRDKMRGHIFENFIVSEALKFRLNQGREANLCFYRDSNGVEVDLLTKKEGLYKAIEIKSSSTYHPDFENGLKSFEKEFGEKVSDYAIVYTGHTEELHRHYKLVNYTNFSRILI